MMLLQSRWTFVKSLSTGMLACVACSAADERRELEQVLAAGCQHQRECDPEGFAFAYGGDTAACVAEQSRLPFGAPRECAVAYRELLECELMLECGQEHAAAALCATQDRRLATACSLPHEEDGSDWPRHHEIVLRADVPPISGWIGAPVGDAIDPSEFVAFYTPATRAADGDTIAEFGFRILLRSDETGTFDLAARPNDRLDTCRQCVFAFENGRFYFQSSGQLTVGDGTEDASLDAGDGVTLTLRDVELAEHDGTGPQVLAWGSTAQVRDVTLERDPVPDGWTCSEYDWQNWTAAVGDIIPLCDCGCGVPDDDCIEGTLVHECQSCDNCEGDNPETTSFEAGTCEGYVDPDDVTQCL